MAESGDLHMEDSNINNDHGNENNNNTSTNDEPLSTTTTSPLKPQEGDVNPSLPTQPATTTTQTPTLPSNLFNLIPDNLLTAPVNSSPSIPIPTPAPIPAPSNPPLSNTPLSFEDFLQSFGGANLSDEEVALKLQEYLEIADAQQAAANAPPSSDTQNAMALQMMDEDEKLAKMLQEEFYSEVTKEPNYSNKSNKWNNAVPVPAPPPPPALVPLSSQNTTSTAPVLLTAQTATSLLKNIGLPTTTSTTSTTTTTSTSTSTTTTTVDTNDKPEEQEKSEEEIICLICHDSEFEEYLILPVCEHRFCMDCAQRMMSNPPSNSYPSYGARRVGKKVGATGTITCAMCESVTELDQDNGLDALKRRVRKRKAGDSFSNVCAEHNQALQFYCFEHSMPVCFACIQHKGPHNNHRYDTLDSAVEKLKTESANKLLTINEKRQKIGEFRASVESNKAQIAANGEQKLVEMQEYVVKIRKLIEKKEKDLETEIKRMVDRKLLAAQQDMKWADEKLAVLDKTIASVGALLDESTTMNTTAGGVSNEEACLKFVHGLADCEELIADSVHLPAKQVNPEQYNLPPLAGAFSITSRALNNLSYNDSRLQQIHYDDYSDEENEDYE